MGDQPSSSEPVLAPFKARRYAVKFDPPCIFLEYEDVAQGKRRVRAVKMSGVQPGVDTDRLTKKVIRSFPRRVEPSSVKYDQVRKLVGKLLERLAAQSNGNGQHQQGAGSPPHGAQYSNGGTTPEHASPCANGTASSRSQPSTPQPLSSLSPTLEHHQRLGLGSPHNHASIESGLSRFGHSTAGNTDADDDDLAAALDELDKEMAGSASILKSSGALSSPARADTASRDSSSNGLRDRPAAAAVPPHVSRPADAPLSSPLSSGTPRTRFAAEEKLTIGIEITSETDLNKATELELKLAKATMETNYLKNRLKPGDPGYVYDKQVEFKPGKEVNEWDDTDDEAEISEDPEINWNEIEAVVAKPVPTMT